MRDKEGFLNNWLIFRIFQLAQLFYVRCKKGKPSFWFALFFLKKNWLIAD